jgi:outer membrane protein assembly factor BamB
VQWSETKNIKWKVRIPGDGSSTPIIWGDKVFVQTAIATGKQGEPSARPEAATTGAPSSGRSSSGSNPLIGRLDTNKDGKIARDEIPEGTLRNVFDRLVAQYKLDPTKVYTREELERLVGDTPAGDRKQSEAKAGTREGDPQRRPGGGRPGGGGPPAGPPGGPGMRGVRPTETHQFALLCLDRNTGKEIWQRVATEEVPHEGRHPTGSFAASSPVTDGKYVFAYFGSRGIYCYDLDGTLRWKQDLGDMRVANGFGEGSSPLLVGNAVIINWDHEGESFIIALDKETGSTIWKKPREERTSWSTPLLVEHDGKAQVVTAATRKIRSYDAASGDLIWECSGLGPNTIPSPVAGEGMIFAMSGFRQFSLLAIRLGGTGDLSNTSSVAWRLDRGTPYVPSPLLYDDRLYFCSGNNAVLSCVDAKSGKSLEEPRRLGDVGTVYASPVGAGGHVYLVGRGGVTAVLTNEDKSTVVATNKLDDSIDASPAVAGNELYLRGHSYLYCIAE